MGYELHITRKNDWSDEDGPDISFDEWAAFVASDPELRLDGFAEATTPAGEVLRMTSPGITAWVSSPGAEPLGWFQWFNGEVSAKVRDSAQLRKMHQIAAVLGARVQGDEGELYEPGGPDPFGDGEAKQAGKRAAKPWWRIW